MKQREVEEKKNKQARAQAIQTGRLRKTGREILQEGGGTFNEEEEGEDMDIMTLLRQRRAEEEALDKENAELVQKLTAEVAESERAFDKKVAELEALGLSAAEAIARLTISSNPAPNPEDDLTSPRVTHTVMEDDEDNEDNQDDENNEENEDGKNILEGVDTDLFEAEAEGDLPEFSEEDENEDN